MSEVITVWKYGLFDIDRVRYSDDAVKFEMLCCFGTARWSLGERDTLKEAQEEVRKHVKWTRRQKSIVGEYTDDYRKMLQEEKAAVEETCTCGDRDR